MSPALAAARAGLARGWIEIRATLTNAQDLGSIAFPAVILAVVMVLMRESTVPGTNFSLGSRTLPSVLGMGVAFTGLVYVAQQLIVEREDGTLLRAKAVPNGMIGYLVGKITLVAGMTLFNIVVQLAAGLLLLDGFALDSPYAWLTLAWVALLGLLATMPIGAILGSLLTDPRNMGLIMLPVMGLIGTSGIFYPITNFPAWLQGLAQVFPMYWLGLGMRSALLPDGMAAAEIGDSWRHLETLGVLGAWAVAGLLVAPVVLRRMARRESGANMVDRRERALQRAM